ncbi:MAG: hypothetical protein AAF371_20225 [Pseudomonadota bacterium]
MTPRETMPRRPADAPGSLALGVEGHEPPRQRRLSRAGTLLAALAFMATGWAGGAAAEERSIVPQLCAARGESGGTVTLSTGCVSSSFQRLDGSPAVTVEDDRATIRLEGGFRYEVPTGATLTDCAGGAIEQVRVESLGARRYSVFADGAYQGILDLTTEPQACTAPESAAGFDAERDGADWKATDRPRWGRLTAPRLVDLLPRLVRDYPTAIEGRPTVEIEIAPSPLNGPDGPRLEVRATGTGYPDDAVTGVRFVLLASPHPDGWRMDELWRQNLCARGSSAGQWTADRCP